MSARVPFFIFISHAFEVELSGLDFVLGAQGWAAWSFPSSGYLWAPDHDCFLLPPPRNDFFPFGWT